MNNHLIETLLYVQGEYGVSPTILKGVLEVSTAEARNQLKTFMEEYNNGEHALRIMEFNDVFKLATKVEFKDTITKMVTIEKKRKLSNSAVEAAGIIADKQPITKSQINLIRGVASEGVVHTLLIKGVIEEKGHANTPGNPTLYGITTKFYDYFNISSLRELPELSQLADPDEVESINLFASQREHE